MARFGTRVIGAFSGLWAGMFIGIFVGAFIGVSSTIWQASFASPSLLLFPFSFSLLVSTFFANFPD
jgi:hypothetical protein